MMKIRFMSEKSIEELKFGIKKGSVASAQKSSDKIRVDYLTPKHIGFTCKTDKGNLYSVIYLNEKKEFKNSWVCDCKWYSLKHTFCKHILEIFICLNKNPNFLKKFEKEKI